MIYMHFSFGTICAVLAAVIWLEGALFFYDEATTQPGVRRRFDDGTGSRLALAISCLLWPFAVVRVLLDRS